MWPSDAVPIHVWYWLVANRLRWLTIRGPIRRISQPEMAVLAIPDWLLGLIITIIVFWWKWLPLFSYYCDDRKWLVTWYSVETKCNDCVVPMNVLPIIYSVLLYCERRWPNVIIVLTVVLLLWYWTSMMMVDINVAILLMILAQWLFNEVYCVGSNIRTDNSIFHNCIENDNEMWQWTKWYLLFYCNGVYCITMTWYYCVPWTTEWLTQYYSYYCLDYSYSNVMKI